MPRRSLDTSILIDAPPAVVWAALTDFPSYEKWNPYIVEIEGRLDLGQKLRMRMRPPGAVVKDAPVRGRLVHVESHRSFTWTSRSLLPGLFDVEHRTTVDPLDRETVRFSQKHEVSGLLVPIFRGTLDKTHIGLRFMNEALKELAELAWARRRAKTETDDRGGTAGPPPPGATDR